MDIKNIIFDLDGTLIDSSKDVIDSLQRAYRSVVPELSVSIDASSIGPQLRELIETLTPGLGEEVSLEISKAFRREYDNSDYPKTRLRPGIGRLLGALKVLSIHMFIVTNKPKKATMRIMKNLHVDGFQAVINPDTRPGVKMTKKQMVSYLIRQYDLVRQQTVMIGDSEADVTAARDNHLLSMVVMDGYGKKKDILNSRPDFLVPQVGELYDFIKELQHHGPSRRISQTNI